MTVKYSLFVAIMIFSQHCLATAGELKISLVKDIAGWKTTVYGKPLSYQHHIFDSGLLGLGDSCRVTLYTDSVEGQLRKSDVSGLVLGPLEHTFQVNSGFMDIVIGMHHVVYADIDFEFQAGDLRNHGRIHCARCTYGNPHQWTVAEIQAQLKDLFLISGTKPSISNDRASRDIGDGIFTREKREEEARAKSMSPAGESKSARNENGKMPEGKIRAIW